MAHVEEILQYGRHHVGLSGFEVFELHGGFFVFGFRGSILIFGVVRTSLGMATFAINSMCYAKVGSG